MRAQSTGLKMADISSSREAIAKVIPAHGSARNPIDIVGDADFNRFEKVLVEVISNPSVGSIVTMCTPSLLWIMTIWLE